MLSHSQSTPMQVNSNLTGCLVPYRMHSWLFHAMILSSAVLIGYRRGPSSRSDKIRRSSGCCEDWGTIIQSTVVIIILYNATFIMPFWYSKQICVSIYSIRIRINYRQHFLTIIYFRKYIQQACIVQQTGNSK